jgi:hypothetical protein
MNPNTQVSLFKREGGNMQLIVPLCLYKSYIYEPGLVTQSAKYNCSEEKDKQNILAFVDKQKSSLSSFDCFDCFVFFPYSTFIHLMETKNIFVYSVKEEEDTIIALYFFKDSCTFHDSDKKRMVTCIGSMRRMSKCTEQMFIECFDLAATSVMKMGPTFQTLIVENISHNDILLRAKVDNKSFVDMAYFFYNYAHPTLPASKCFICI